MKRIKKIIIVLLLLLVILLIINTLRNYIIIRKIRNKQLEYKDCTNYSYIRVDYSTQENSAKRELKVHYKDGIGTMELPEENKVWYNTETDEMIAYNVIEKKARITNNGYLAGIEKPFDMEHFAWQEKMLMYICSIITSDNVDDEECYCLQEVSQGKQYISKESGIPIKRIGESTITSNGQTYESVVEIKNWKINTVTEEDVRKPDLLEYEVNENTK